jgi:hypothetical protein
VLGSGGRSGQFGAQEGHDAASMNKTGTGAIALRSRWHPV